jgi:hypothetical protein
MSGVKDKVYIYRKLTQRNSIRLLRIEPGNTERMRFYLETTSLTQLSRPSPTYEALSYVWGTGDRSVAISSAEGSIKVTKDLGDALRRLRLPDQPRYLWVDAVCINQSDDGERGHQVRLMRKIYKRTESVLIWLGKDEQNQAGAAFSIARAIASGGYVQGQPVGEASFTKRGISIDEHLPPPPADLISWGAVASLFGNSWFWRVWCIQEVALAASAIVLWGDFEIPWRWLGLAATRIRINYYQFLRSYRMSGVFGAYLIYRISQGDVDADPAKISFLDLLAMTRQFEATNPRDHIYSLLGIATTDSNPGAGELYMEPNYRLEREDVYRELAQKAVHSGDLLKLLSSVQHGPEIADNWPSWIPQWDKVYTSTLFPFFTDSITPSSPYQSLEYPCVEGDTLKVKGCQVSAVHQVLPRLLLEPENNFFSPFSEYQRQKLLNLLNTPDGQMRFCFTLTAGQSWRGEHIVNRFGHLNDFAAFVRKREPDIASYFAERSGGDSDSFEIAASSACMGRQLFFDDHGRLGLGPAAMKPGDWVCTIHGGNIPFIVRSRDEYLLLVGECYLYDYMECGAERPWQAEELTDQPFEFH